MKKAEVKVGGIYLANVSGKRVRVQILREVERTSHRTNRYSGALDYTYRTNWEARNTTTGRTVQIKSAARLTPVS